MAGGQIETSEKVVNGAVHIAMQREHRIVLFALAHHWGATIAVPRNQICEVHFFHLRQRQASRRALPLHGGTSYLRPCTLPARKVAIKSGPAEPGRSTTPK
jgi:hypothetical protein